MALKKLEVVAPMAAEASIRKIAEMEGVISCCKMAEIEGEHIVYHLLTVAGQRQKIIDSLHSLAASSTQFRINIAPVDATLPRVEIPSSADTREELNQKMEQGARLDFNYLLLTFLSTIVALIGLLQDNVAVVIGAMVIAPFLGPNLAFAFGTSLGNKHLMVDAFKSGTIGVLFAIGIASIFGFFWPSVPESGELMGRTTIGLDGVALAVASGVAGVLSLTSGLSMTLVGVMVAVALLPPAATLGFMLGAQQFQLALGAFVLLSVNVVCVNLSGLLVFFAKGIKPRIWFERRMARPFVYGGIVVWSSLLIVLLIAMSQM